MPEEVIRKIKSGEMLLEIITGPGYDTHEKEIARKRGSRSLDKNHFCNCNPAMFAYAGPHH